MVSLFVVLHVVPPRSIPCRPHSPPPLGPAKSPKCPPAQVQLASCG
jgi:hypothetical protein